MNLKISALFPSGGNYRTHWQSIRSVIPPCPGIECPKSLMLKALLNPEAKNPPKGATREAKVAITKAWIWNGAHEIDGADRPSWFVSLQYSRCALAVLTIVCKTCLAAPVNWYSRQTKTGLGRHVMCDKTLVPRSRAGQIMYGNLMKKVDHYEYQLDAPIKYSRRRQLTAQPKIRVHKKAPMNPSMVFLGLSLMSGVFPNALPEYQLRSPR